VTPTEISSFLLLPTQRAPRFPRERVAQLGPLYLHSHPRPRAIPPPLLPFTFLRHSQRICCVPPFNSLYPLLFPVPARPPYSHRSHPRTADHAPKHRVLSPRGLSTTRFGHHRLPNRPLFVAFVPSHRHPPTPWCPVATYCRDEVESAIYNPVPRPYQFHTTTNPVSTLMN
jgi:hypothetical protein